jgi:hypothetical protein
LLFAKTACIPHDSVHQVPFRCRAKQLLSDEETEDKEQPNGDYMDLDNNGANGTMFVLE